MTEYGYALGGGQPTNIVEVLDNVNNVWNIKQPLNTSRKQHTSFSINGLDGYAISGNIASTGYNIINTTENYDGNSWSYKTNIPTGRVRSGGFTLNNIGYISGGSSGISGVIITESYDNINDSWLTKGSISEPKSNVGAFSISMYGYIIGGSVPYGDGYSNRTEKYDYISDVFTYTSNMTIGNQNFASFVLNGYGYISGGWGGPWRSLTDKFDSTSNTWTRLTSVLNSAVSEHTGFAVNGYGYSLGGFNSLGNSANTERYDDISNIWITTSANLNNARTSLTSFVLTTTSCPPLTCSLYVT